MSNSEDALFTIERTYPNGDKRKIHLEIESKNELPAAFFVDLMMLVKKYCTDKQGGTLVITT